MRSVVGTDGCYASVVECSTQSVTVGSCLDCRIALDACSECGIVGIREEQMGYDSLCGDARVVAEELQLACCGEVCYVQTSSGLLCKFYSQTRRLPACLLRTNLGMMLYSRVVAILGFSLCHVAIDYVGVLAMRHDGQLRFCKQLLQHFLAVDEHIARA